MIPTPLEQQYLSLFREMMNRTDINPGSKLEKEYMERLNAIGKKMRKPKDMNSKLKRIIAETQEAWFDELMYEENVCAAENN